MRAFLSDPELYGTDRCGPCRQAHDGQWNAESVTRAQEAAMGEARAILAESESGDRPDKAHRSIPRIAYWRHAAATDKRRKRIGVGVEMAVLWKDDFAAHTALAESLAAFIRAPIPEPGE